MFQFSPLAPHRLWIQRWVTRHDSRRVSPFGHPRINAYVRLPEAFRSLSRPSSPVRAKASTVRPCSLDRYLRTPLARRGSTPVHRFPDRHTGWCSRASLDATNNNTQSHYPSFQSTRIEECPNRTSTCELAFDHPCGRLTRGSRKEVIQPQVPLRLPCYDFAPVIGLTFDGCLPCGLAHRLQVPPTSMA